MKTKTVERMEFKLKEWLKKLIPEDYDKFDASSHIDPTLNFQENKGEILEKIRLLINPEITNQILGKEARGILKAETEQKNRKEETEAEEYNEKTEQEIKNTIVNLDKYFEIVKSGIRKLVAGYVNALFIKGITSTGKSFCIRKELDSLNADYVIINSNPTPAYLYRILYEHNNKIIWLQDSSNIMNNIGSINTLKAALETEDERVMTKRSYSQQQSDLPESFIFKGKLIFDFNSTFGLPKGLRDDFEALMSRGEIIDITFCFEDICNIMKKVCTEEWQREVTEHLINNYEFKGENNLNLRTQWHAFKTYKYSKEKGLDWRVELNKSFINKESHIRRLVYRFIGKRTVRTSELIKLLLRGKIFNSVPTASKRISEWVYTEEIYKLSSENRNYYVCLYPK